MHQLAILKKDPFEIWRLCVEQIVSVPMSCLAGKCLYWLSLLPLRV